jgi:thioredoxin 2
MHLVCPRCITKNRVAPERLGDEPRCGSCGAPLLALAPVDLPGDALDRYVAGTTMPVVADFWAEWCGPCKMMAPAFEEAARRRPDVRFVKVDSDASAAASTRYGVRSIPTLILFRDGRESARQSGAMSVAQLLGWIDQKLR